MSPDSPEAAHGEEQDNTPKPARSSPPALAKLVQAAEDLHHRLSLDAEKEKTRLRDRFLAFREAHPTEYKVLMEHFATSYTGVCPFHAHMELGPVESIETASQSSMPGSSAQSSTLPLKVMEFAIEQLIADSFITGTWLNTGDQALEASKRALSVLSVSEEKNEDRATQAAQPKTSPYCEKESAEKGTDALGEN